MPSALRRITYHALPWVALALTAPSAFAQGGGEEDAPRAIINQSTDPLLKTFRFRNIGPASMGGRIDDIAVSESNPNVIYIGYAVGGLWKSDNNATSFTPVFDTYEVASIGDVAIHPTNPNIVYVGTGEPNNRQTASFGAGLYKTTDGGKSFQLIGLRETQTISRIVIDPRNPETVYVASPGPLFGPSPDRGIYKTTDGGKTWSKIKYVDENTGFNDLAIDRSNPSVLYASSYQRRRDTCCFNGGGPGSAVWKTTDGGRSWSKLTSGLPTGVTYGRIALDVSRSNPGTVYVQIEAGPTGQPDAGRGRGGAPGAPGAEEAGRAGGGGGGGGGGFGGGGFDWCNNAGPGRGFGRAGGGGGGRAGRAGGAAQPETAPALEANRSGVFRSDNGGASFRLVSNCNARPMYFSQLRIDAMNPDILYVAGLPVAKSLDGGKTFATLDEAGGYGEPGHVDQHAIWVDPKNSNHLMIGNDGGLDITYDQGKNWDYVNTMTTSLAYDVSADMRRPYWVCAGLQDNGSWCGPSAQRPGGNGILNADWWRTGGGDGFYTGMDQEDWTVVYSESQNGNTNRVEVKTGRSVLIRPRGLAPQGGRGGGGGGGGGAANAGPNVVNASPNDGPYRFNWNTPYQLSPHNTSVIWYGGNRLFKSYDRGDTWVQSPDLTRQYDRNTHEIMGVAGNLTMLSKNDGLSAYSTIITVAESPIKPGLVWAGTDDGLVQVTRDNMATFTEVSKNLPGLPPNNMYWVSRVAPSAYDTATAYVSVDGHRSNDLKPYLFVTHDFGKTFTSISGNLPAYGNIQVVTEDPKNRNVLYVGTEFGLYISMNAGQSWQKFMNGYPTVRTDDILVHPRDGDLIIATHGRGLWIADDITPLQQLTAAVQGEDVHLFDVRPAVAYITDRRLGSQVGGQKMFAGENAPRGTYISYYLKSAATGDVKVTIKDALGREIRSMDGPKTAGINRVLWNLAPNAPTLLAGRGGGGGRGGGAMVDAGTYAVTLTVGGVSQTKTVQVLKDEWLFER